MSISARLQALMESPSRGVRDEIEITKLENEMSKMAELAYDIEQLYIEGYSASQIAIKLNCPIAQVQGWLDYEGVADLQQEEDASPFGTINS
jgi:DNA-directed RNA polymerase specialized sigma24 family protein